jgi:hypothetical protein
VAFAASAGGSGNTTCRKLDVSGENLRDDMARRRLYQLVIRSETLPTREKFDREKFETEYTRIRAERRARNDEALQELREKNWPRWLQYLHGRYDASANAEE